MAINFQDHSFVFHRVGGHAVYFEIANQDRTDATYHYFGYVSTSGSWIIQRFHMIGSAVIYEYAGGQARTTYDALWDASGVYIGELTFRTIDQVKNNV